MTTINKYGIAVAVGAALSTLPAAGNALTITPPLDIAITTDPNQPFGTHFVPFPSVSGNVGAVTYDCTPDCGLNHQLAIGTTGIQFLVTDAAGNFASASSFVTVEDTENPTITAPADLTLEIMEPGGVTATLPNATGDDNSGEPVLVTCNIGCTIPAFFPLGTTTVFYTGIDGAGNSSSATTTVTVQDTTGPEFAGGVGPGHIDFGGDFTLNPDVFDLSGAFTLTAELVGVGLISPTATLTELDYENATGISDYGGNPGGVFSVIYTATDGFGNSSQHTQFVSVPEPGAPAYFALGAAGFLIARRRKRLS